MAMIYLIDPPTPFSPREEWEAYLLQVRALIHNDPDSEQLKDEERAAVKELAHIKAL
jgi:hypothetical protein